MNSTTKLAIPLLILATVACNLFNNLSPNVDIPPISTASPVAIAPTNTAAPDTPTAKSPPTNTPVVFSPAKNKDTPNLQPYHNAMLPQFQTDVDQVAAQGVSIYTIEVSLDFGSLKNGSNLQLYGTEQVRYTNTEDVPLSEIYFRLYPNLPGYGGQMRVNGMQVDKQLVKPTLEAENSALRVPLPEPLMPGNSIEIDLDFEATVPAKPQKGYNIFSYTDNTAALAGFYPAVAVFDDEGWNIEIPPTYGDATYLDTSLYQVQLTVPEEMVVAASGSTLDSVSNSNGTKTLSLASGPMRDFYVVMNPDYKIANQVVDGVTVNSYFLPSQEQGGQLALRYAADALRVFNRRFGQYPYAEFDVVATPTSAGGVEYPGIVVIANRLYNSEGGFFEHATAHEVAHQWWYGLVGNDQVDEPWLDEALTNYSAIVYWEDVKGEEAAKFVTDAYLLSAYEQAKNQGVDMPVFGPVSDFTQAEYGTFVYGKGPLFFKALREEVGDDVYFEIMRTYFLRHKYGVAQANSLFSTIEEVTGKSVRPLVEMWLAGK